jgi:hypothetical protein
MCYPFDASCPSCDTYGYCRRQLTYPEAVQNVSAHYAQKGLKVSMSGGSEDLRRPRIRSVHQICLITYLMAGENVMLHYL